MGPGRKPEECENDELVHEFEFACRAGDYEFANQYKTEILKRLGAELRPSVRWFAEQMEIVLRENDHKGGWENENIYWLWGRLKEESKELITAVNLTRDVHADPDNIVKEAADVSNFAMMIADIARKKLKN